MNDSNLDPNMAKLMLSVVGIHAQMPVVTAPLYAKYYQDGSLQDIMAVLRRNLNSSEFSGDFGGIYHAIMQVQIRMTDDTHFNQHGNHIDQSLVDTMNKDFNELEHRMEVKLQAKERDWIMMQ
jgi:hypothetical protein